jgi:hypothetical protein
VLALPPITDDNIARAQKAIMHAANSIVADCLFPVRPAQSALRAAFARPALMLPINAMFVDATGNACRMALTQEGRTSTSAYIAGGKRGVA